MSEMFSRSQTERAEGLLGLKALADRCEILEERAIYEENLTEFVKGAWSSVDSAEYRENWAIDAMCDHLEAVTYGHIPRLLINISPRCSKTTITQLCWTSWTWARSEVSFLSGPQVKFLCGGYNDRLSMRSATGQRRLIQSQWYQRLWGDRFSLTADQASKAQFDNTKGGSRISTSVRGSLLGLGGDIINIDDPHNTETEKVIESDADRHLVAGWWREISSTRLNDPKQSAIVVTMQRLHEEDLSGIILDSDEEFVHLCIPMEFNRSRYTVVLPQYNDHEPWCDPRAVDGELMWPERFGPVEVERIKKNLGPYMASGRLQQEPVPKGGGILQRAWWQPWDTVEARKYGLDWNKNQKDYPPMELICASLDTSYGEKQENDFNALTVWGMWLDLVGNRRAMLMFGWQKRLPLHGKVVTAKAGEAKVQFVERQKAAWGLVEWVADTCKRYKVQRLFIENKARGADVAGEINRLYARENWGVQLLNPVKDKTSRVHSIVPLFTDDAIWAPDTRWSEEIIVQCASFPKATHDDFVDSCTQFLQWARENSILVRADEMSAALEEEAEYQPRNDGVANNYGVG